MTVQLRALLRKFAVFCTNTVGAHSFCASIAKLTVTAPGQFQVLTPTPLATGTTAATQQQQQRPPMHQQQQQQQHRVYKHIVTYSATCACVRVDVYVCYLASLLAVCLFFQYTRMVTVSCTEGIRTLAGEALYLPKPNESQEDLECL